MKRPVQIGHRVSFLFSPQKETINFFRESSAYEEYECRTPDKECFYGGSKRYRRNMEKGRTIQVRKNKAGSVKLLKEIEKHTKPMRPGRQDKRTLQAKGGAKTQKNPPYIFFNYFLINIL